MGNPEALFVSAEAAAPMLGCSVDTLYDWLHDDQFAAAIGAWRPRGYGEWRISKYRLRCFAENPAAYLDPSAQLNQVVGSAPPPG